MQSYDQLGPVMGAYRENACCTVVALACTLDWSFGKAHRFMAKHGRQNRMGMRMCDWLPALREAALKDGKKVQRVDDATGMTINRFVKTHPRGTYYVRVKAHALAVVDGQIQDWTAGTAQRRKILDCFEITK